MKNKYENGMSEIETRNLLVHKLPGCLAHLYHMMMNGIMSEKNVISQIKSELHTLAQVDNRLDNAVSEIANADDKYDVELLLLANLTKILSEIKFVEQFHSKTVTYQGIYIQKAEEEIPVTHFPLKCWYEKDGKQVEQNFQRWIIIQESMAPGVTKGKY